MCVSCIIIMVSLEGLKVELLTSLLPSIKDKAFKVNATYKQPHCHTVATMDVLKVYVKGDLDMDNITHILASVIESLAYNISDRSKWICVGR